MGRQRLAATAVLAAPSLAAGVGVRGDGAGTGPTGFTLGPDRTGGSTRIQEGTTGSSGGSDGPTGPTGTPGGTASAGPPVAAAQGVRP